MLLFCYLYRAASKCSFISSQEVCSSCLTVCPFGCDIVGKNINAVVLFIYCILFQYTSSHYFHSSFHFKTVITLIEIYYLVMSSVTLSALLYLSSGVFFSSSTDISLLSWTLFSYVLKSLSFLLLSSSCNFLKINIYVDQILLIKIY